MQKQEKESEEPVQNPFPSEDLTHSLSHINREFREFANDILADEKNP